MTNSLPSLLASALCHHQTGNLPQTVSPISPQQTARVAAEIEHLDLSAKEDLIDQIHRDQPVALAAMVRLHREGADYKTVGSPAPSAEGAILVGAGRPRRRLDRRVLMEIDVWIQPLRQPDVAVPGQRLALRERRVDFTVSDMRSPVR
jgi:hypothetical protein